MLVELVYAVASFLAMTVKVVYAVALLCGLQLFAMIVLNNNKHGVIVSNEAKEGNPITKSPNTITHF